MDNLERKKTEIQTCHYSTTNQIRQINAFTYSYAYKYPDCADSLDCNECPYNHSKTITSNNKDKFINYLNQFRTTPENVVRDQLSDDQKLELFLVHLDEYRTPFHKEEERIIYTEYFRRLQYKTQVMINSASDDQRTRLLHSLEVQKIARKISMALHANYELAETIAISHDLGHSPFGHAGERAINKYLENAMAGSFSHALQSVKAADYICSHRVLKPMGLRGLGISDYVLEGILKHDTDSFSENMASAAYRLQYDCPELYKPVGIDGDFENDRLYIGGIENQIVYMADKIAYMSHDWEEFVAVGLLETMLQRLNSMVIQLDEMVNDCSNPKYAYIANIERDGLKRINGLFCELKDVFNADNYSEKYEYERDDFVKKLLNLNQELNNIINLQKKYPTSFVFFSNEQYQLFYDFFMITWSWIVITGRKPKKVGGKMDVIFVCYEYLLSTTSYVAVPALINALISSCKEELDELNEKNMSREGFIQKCNEPWLQKFKELYNKNGTNVFTNEEKKALKGTFRDSIAVKFERDYAKASRYIQKFIITQFINSTRVEIMTFKAKMIVDKLLDFYYNNPEMLPLKYRKRIEMNTGLATIKDRIKELLKQYYFSRIDVAIQEDSSASEKNKNFHIVKNLIKQKLDRLNIELGDNLSDQSDELKEQIKQLIESDDKFAVDAIKLREIADYVSGMTDRMAEKKYNEIVSSSTHWSKAFTERATYNI